MRLREMIDLLERHLPTLDVSWTAFTLPDGQAGQTSETSPRALRTALEALNSLQFLQRDIKHIRAGHAALVDSPLPNLMGHAQAVNALEAELDRLFDVGHRTQQALQVRCPRDAHLSVRALARRHDLS
jgi:hypothetical protein